jgi:hypothetical protein
MWLVGDHLLLGDSGPCGIMLMNVLIESLPYYGEHLVFMDLALWDITSLMADYVYVLLYNAAA